jgi:hypothetical protein
MSATKKQRAFRERIADADRYAGSALEAYSNPKVVTQMT